MESGLTKRAVDFILKTENESPGADGKTSISCVNDSNPVLRKELYNGVYRKESKK